MGKSFFDHGWLYPLVISVSVLDNAHVVIEEQVKIMMPIRRISLIAGSAAIAAALTGVTPAQAEDATMLTVAEPVELNAVTDTEIIDVANLDLNDGEESEFVAAPVNIAAPEAVAEAPAAPVTTTSAALVLDESVATDASTLLAAETPDGALLAQAEEVAQVTRPLYRGASPFYVGVGGNVGIADSNESATGDFGFALISKISLGPRFSLRPSLIVSEDKVSLPIPLTYNFDPISAGENIAIYPFAGIGADVSFDGETGFLINGGVDIPISRAFTLNAQTNWRVTGDFGLCLILGVGYNFPFFFE